MKTRQKALAAAVLAISFGVLAGSASAEAPSCQSTDAFCYQPAATALSDSIRQVTVPNIAVPVWLGANDE